MVSARTDEEEGNFKNATLFNVQGNVLKTFEFDDAIQDVQTTKDSDIWVSYFDENMDSGLNVMIKKESKHLITPILSFKQGEKFHS